MYDEYTTVFISRSQIPAGKIDNLNFILSAVESSSLSIPSHKPDPNRVNCSIHALKCRVLSQPRDDCVIVESLKGSSRCLVPMNNIRPIPLGDIASTYPLGTTLFVNQVGIIESFPDLNARFINEMFDLVNILFSGSQLTDRGRFLTKNTNDPNCQNQIFTTKNVN